MACVTLKRPLDLDPYEAVHSSNRPPPAKIQRCSPMKGVQSPSSSPSFPESAADKADQLREKLLAARQKIEDGASTTRRRRTTLMAVDEASSSDVSDDRPVFTLSEMKTICEEIWKDRHETLRREYDQILEQKLSEQYDAFIKFIDQLIQERFRHAQAPDYFS